MTTKRGNYLRNVLFSSAGKYNELIGTNIKQNERNIFNIYTTNRMATVLLKLSKSCPNLLFIIIHYTWAQ